MIKKEKLLLWIEWQYKMAHKDIDTSSNPEVIDRAIGATYILEDLKAFIENGVFDNEN